MAFAILGSAAQARTTEDEQIWLNATVMQTTAKGFAWFAEVQPRFGDGAGSLQQLIVRPAVGWRLSSKFTAYAGYAHVAVVRANAPDRNEERFFGQLNWSLGKVGGGTMSSRSRLEHRALSNGRETGWRAREMLRYVHPIASPAGPRALVSAEGFWALNDTDWGARSGFDQLRSFAGAEVPIGGKNTLELGYLNQLINDPARQKRMNHVASIAIFIRL